MPCDTIVVGQRYTAYVMADKLHLVTGECTHVTDYYCALNTGQLDANGAPVATFKFALADAHVVSPPHNMTSLKTVQVPSPEYFNLFNSEHLTLTPTLITGEAFERCVANGGIIGYDGRTSCDLSAAILPPHATFWGNISAFGERLKDLATADVVHKIIESMDVTGEIRNLEAEIKACDDVQTAIQECVNLIYAHRVLFVYLAILSDEYLLGNPRFEGYKIQIWDNLAGIFKLPQVKPPGDNTVHRSLRHH